VNKRPLSIISAVAFGAVLAGCQSTSSGPAAPPVTAAVLASGARQHADAAMLEAGRSLFIGRCARCHALPNVAEHGTQQWPGIVAKMSKRSGLKPDQSRAVLAYLLAARTE
jgi:cytochrome c5